MIRYDKTGRHSPVIGLFAVLLLAAAMVLNGCISGGGPAAAPPAKRTVTDMTGREVTVPAKIGKIYGTSGVATIFIYTLDAELLAGWNSELAEEEKHYIPAELHQLPVLGAWFNRGGANAEEVIKVKPDLIISMGNTTPSDKDAADRIQQQTGIPVVLMDSQLSRLAEAYQFLGMLTGREERAGVLAEYCRSTLSGLEAGYGKIKTKQRIYYAEGPAGLQTDPRGSLHSEGLEAAGGENAAGSDIPLGGNAGRTAVSFEQVMRWDPDVILVDDAAPPYLSEERWQGLRAVKTGKVYAIPAQPYNWMGRPPSVNRLIGLKWLSNRLYPEVYNWNMTDEVKRFYSLFYHYTLSDDEAISILSR